MHILVEMSPVLPEQVRNCSELDVWQWECSDKLWGDLEPCTVSNMPYQGTQRIIFWRVSATVAVMIYYKKSLHLLCPNPHSSFLCFAAYSSISSSYQNVIPFFQAFLVWFTLSHRVFIFFLFLIATDVLYPRRYIHLFIYSQFFQILFISGW